MPRESVQKYPVDPLFQLIKSRYGDRLTTQQLDEVRIGIQGVADLAEELRQVRLDNADEPFAIFQPYQGIDNGE